MHDERNSVKTHDRAKDGKDGNICVKTEEDVQTKELKMDDDIAVVLVEVNRMINASIANTNDVNSNEESKKNNNTNGDGDKKKMVTSVHLQKKCRKKNAH